MSKRANHLPWPDFHEELFIQGAGGPLPVLLDIYQPLRKLSEEREKQKRPALDGAYVGPSLLVGRPTGNWSLSVGHIASR